MNLTNTISLIEVVWVVVTTVGMIYKVLNAYDSWLAKEWLKNSGKNGYRQIVAAGTLKADLARAAVMVLLWISGITSLTLPSQPTLGFTQDLMLKGGFIVSAVLLCYAGYEAHKTRDRVINFRD